MDTDRLYWLLSTIAQTLGTIVGFIGMLTVYRLQLISNYMTKIMEESEGARKIFFVHPGIIITDQTPEQFIAQFEIWLNERRLSKKLIEDEKTIWETSKAWNKINNYYSDRQILIFKFMLFFIPSLFLIILSIIGILWCPIFVKINETAINIVIGAFLLYVFISTTNICLAIVGWQLKRKEQKNSISILKSVDKILSKNSGTKQMSSNITNE